MFESRIRQEALGRTEIVDDSYVIIDNQGWFTMSPVKEPTNPGYDFEVYTRQYRLKEHQNSDFAHAIIEAGSSCPPQLVIREGQIRDYPVKGKGLFLFLEPGATRVNFIDFDSEGKRSSKFKLVYGPGLYICWKAITRLEFFEICQPPYQEGDLKDLDLNASYIPRPFVDACRRLDIH